MRAAQDQAASRWSPGKVLLLLDVQMGKQETELERKELSLGDSSVFSPTSESLSSNDPPQASENCHLWRDSYHCCSGIGRPRKKPKGLGM